MRPLVKRSVERDYSRLKQLLEGLSPFTPPQDSQAIMTHLAALFLPAHSWRGLNLRRGERSRGALPTR